MRGRVMFGVPGPFLGSLFTLVAGSWFGVTLLVAFSE
jgi:hypothetical protein